MNLIGCFNRQRALLGATLRTAAAAVVIQRSAAVSTSVLRKRLLYQSRKRGISETCIICGIFAKDFLPRMTPRELIDYDNLINTVESDWDLYYWITGARDDIPNELNTDVFRMLRDYTRKLPQTQQPDLGDS